MDPVESIIQLTQGSAKALTAEIQAAYADTELEWTDELNTAVHNTISAHLHEALIEVALVVFAFTTRQRQS